MQRINDGHHIKQQVTQHIPNILHIPEVNGQHGQDHTHAGAEHQQNKHGHKEQHRVAV